MEPNQPTQEPPVNEQDEGLRAAPAAPAPQAMPSSAPDWQQDAVNGAVQSQSSQSSAPGMPSQMLTQPTPPVVTSDGQNGFGSPVAPTVSGPQMAQPPVPGVPSSTPMVGGSMGMPAPASSGGGNAKRIILMIAVLVVIAGAAYGAYLLLHKAQTTHDKNATNNAASQSTKSTSAPELNTLASFTFVQPTAAEMNGLTVEAGGGTSNAESILANSDGNCFVYYGVFSQTAMPGTTIGDVVEKATTTLKANNVTINGPTTIPALVLKNSSTSASYSLPSVEFSYTKSGTSEVAIYSITQLKDGTHAAVLQVCAAKNSTVAQMTDKLNQTITPAAKAIKIQTP